jgi:hypothetical protein
VARRIETAEGFATEGDRTMTKCKGCGKEFRRGSLAFLLTVDGIKGARLCQTCVAGGVTIVAPKLGPVVRQVVGNDKEQVDKVLRQLRTYARVASAGAASAYQLGRAEGFEGAIELIKREMT